jgi:hypothetical protein
MRLQIRFIIFGALFLFGFLGLTLLLQSTGLGDYEPVLFVSWFLLFAVAQFFVFRCPHCHRSAMFGPYRQYRSFLGSRCPHCGKDY